jgi:hypothetical protein
VVIAGVLALLGCGSGDDEPSCTGDGCGGEPGDGDDGGDGDGDDDGGVDPVIDIDACTQCLSEQCESAMQTCDEIDACKTVVDCVIANECWFDDGTCVTGSCTTELSRATVESGNATLHLQSCSLSTCADECAYSGGGAIGGEPGCSDACAWSKDGECDDRGEGSLYDACLFGTDCTDCGSREGQSQPSCSEECRFSNDGECDDGGPGAFTDECRFSTDCLDCGAR